MGAADARSGWRGSSGAAYRVGDAEEEPCEQATTHWAGDVYPDASEDRIAHRVDNGQRTVGECRRVREAHEREHRDGRIEGAAAHATDGDGAGEDSETDCESVVGVALLHR